MASTELSSERREAIAQLASIFSNVDTEAVRRLAVLLQSQQQQKQNHSPQLNNLHPPVKQDVDEKDEDALPANKNALDHTSSMTKEEETMQEGSTTNFQKKFHHHDFNAGDESSDDDDEDDDKYTLRI